MHEMKNLLGEWIANLLESGERIQTYTLLQRLCTHIHQTLSYRVREKLGVQTAEQTLSGGTGYCRDFAALLKVAAQCLVFAARYVNGYPAPAATGIFILKSDFAKGHTYPWLQMLGWTCITYRNRRRPDDRRKYNFEGQIERCTQYQDNTRIGGVRFCRIAITYLPDHKDFGR